MDLIETRQKKIDEKGSNKAFALKLNQVVGELRYR